MNGRWTRFVALGDSLTEGIGDPGGDGVPRGWADRFAEELACRQGGLRYANLAVRGLGTAAVLDRQLAPAVTMRPDLASLLVGMNDLIMPRVAMSGVLARYDALLAGLIGTGATVLTATLPDPGHLVPLPDLVRRRFTARLIRFNDHVRRRADRSGALCLELAELALGDASGWSADRLHPGPYGHQVLADEFLALLTGSRSERSETRPAAIESEPAGVRDQVRWFAGAAAPWLWRRITGRAGPVLAKQPDYRVLVG